MPRTIRELDARISELLAANNREVERRRRAETALRVVLDRIKGTCAEDWVAQNGAYPGGLSDYLISVLEGENG